MTIYIVLGERENVYQDKIGEGFIPHPEKEVVKAFESYEEANQFILSQRLPKPKTKHFGDTSYYKGGFLDMEIQSIELVKAKKLTKLGNDH